MVVTWWIVAFLRSVPISQQGDHLMDDALQYLMSSALDLFVSLSPPPPPPLSPNPSCLILR